MEPKTLEDYLEQINQYILLHVPEDQQAIFIAGIEYGFNLPH